MNKKTIIIFSLIIIISLIVAIFCILKKDNKERTKEMYQKINDSQNFTFSMEKIDDDFNYKVSMAQRGTDVSIDMNSDGEHTTTIVLNNESYYIMHDEKEYYSYGDEQVDADIVIYGLKNIILNKFTTGTETIEGKKYYFEEFDNEKMDFIIYADVNEESKVKTRFYFDGNKLAYIKNIIQNGENKQEELIKANIVFEVDDKLFEIPNDYAETM